MPLLALALLAPLTLAQPASAEVRWGFHHNWHWYCHEPSADSSRVVHYSARCAPGERKIEVADQMAAAGQAGAETVRIPVRWITVERSAPTRDEGGGWAHSYVWDAVDQRYHWAVAAEQEVVMTLTTAPEWAAQRGAVAQCTDPSHCAYAPAPRQMHHWKAFVEEAMRRYGEHTIAFEIWNEPNLRHFHFPAPDVRLYAKTLQWAHRARRASGYRGDVVSGGLSPVGGRGTRTLDPARFLDGLYRHARKRWFDGIGFHPYPGEPPWIKSMWSKIRPIMRVRRENGDERTGLWLTEFGLRSSADMARDRWAPVSVSEAQQGRVLTRLIRSFDRHERARVEAAHVYTMVEVSEQGPFWEPFGLLRANLDPKPAYCYLRAELGGKGGRCGARQAASS